MSAPRKRRSRAECERRILDAARALFLERGFEGVSTREIARCAGTSETLVFRYFGSKSGLFEEVLLGPVAELMSQVLQADLDGGAFEITRAFVSATLDFVEANRPLLAAFVAQRLSASPSPATDVLGLSRFFDLAEAEIRRRMPGGDAVLRPSAAMLARLNLGLVLGAGLLGDLLFPQPRPSRDEIAEAVARMIVSTVAEPRPLV